ncbi:MULTISPECIES: cytochrome c [unclassified Pseudomonas]|jgi:D-sorbitol dehydrogenase (acceptor)|uniref:c-type cytochrome n=1 Tax=unclassified Pseudomonas TaxID=196821 RepID=UPI0015A496B5|nr:MULTISPECIES: cytochrome c [unclassified Pseudomonas]MDQ0670309.1 mono/diheme cytochrome c family protein [Pseudomonas sp. W2I6]NWA32281.1 c-type cytochrome [Pseudomonas sp. C6002]
MGLLKFPLLALLLTALPVFAAEDTAALIQKGAYVARAGDCEACHRTAENGGAPLAGGYVIDSPMGKIISSNITPSKAYGIGDYTEQQLADALRKGINAKGQHLYPAMPYTSYQGMSDDDIHALYVYLQQGVKAVDQPVPETHLAFPFNIRQLMFGWNLVFLDSQGFVPKPGATEQTSRGQYLVDNLAHCGACHTPRNALMAEDNSQYLAGAKLGGWVAPNITSDKVSGLGDWSEDDLVNFLKNGHLADKAQAAGGMAEAVENSFRYLSDSDLHAMAAYLHSVPPIRDPGQTERVVRDVKPVDMSTLETGQGDQASLADATGLDGARLYNSACSSCHGRDGQGSADKFYPSLSLNTALNGNQANNLVMAIIAGIDRKGADGAVSMPALGGDLNDAQIAAIANYSLQTFGNPALSVSSEEVTSLRRGGDAPLLITAMPYLLWGGGLVVLVLIIVLLLWRRHHQHLRAVEAKRIALNRRFHSN